MENIEFALNLCGHWTLSILDDEKLLDNIKREVSKDIVINSEAPEVKRIYVGSEFCNQFVNFITIEKLHRIIEYAGTNGLAFTFVIPNVVENNLEHVKKLVTCLAKNAPDTTEIVVNEYGMLNYISEAFSGITLAAGRLLNKMRRDPRLDLFSLEGIKNKDDLKESGLYAIHTVEWLKKLNVKRVEFDLLETGINIERPDEMFDISFHFPWVYVASGQLCPLGSMNKENNEKFKLYNKCSYECGKYYSILRHPVFRGQVFQSGNAIIYKPLYNGTEVNELLLKYRSRLVYTLYNIDEE